jgi:hypothetical protein
MRVANARQALIMASSRQKAAARSNIKKAPDAARKKRTLAHLPGATRAALAKRGAQLAARKRRTDGQ